MSHRSPKRQETDQVQPRAQFAASITSEDPTMPSIAAPQQAVPDDDDMPTSRSYLDLLKNLGPKVSHRPKKFEDLPGEIRNAIYRAICEDEVRISPTHWLKVPEYDVYIDEYTVSKPFSMLQVNRQIQNEFFNVLFPANHPVNSGLPFGMILIQSELRISTETGPSQMALFHPDVTARFCHEEADLVEVLFTVFLPEGVEFAKESYDLIDDTISESFDNEDDFTVLHFLVALDRVWGLKIALDVENWKEPNLSDLEGSEVEDVLNNDEGQTEYVFRLVMEPDGPDGSVVISMDTERIDPYY